MFSDMAVPVINASNTISGILISLANVSTDMVSADSIITLFAKRDDAVRAHHVGAHVRQADQYPGDRIARIYHGNGHVAKHAGVSGTGPKPCSSGGSDQCHRSQ